MSRYHLHLLRRKNFPPELTHEGPSRLTRIGRSMMNLLQPPERPSRAAAASAAGGNERGGIGVEDEMTVTLTSWQILLEVRARPAPIGAQRIMTIGPPDSEYDALDNVPAGLWSTWWDGHKRIGDEDFIVDFQRFCYRRLLMESTADIIQKEAVRVLMMTEELTALAKRPDAVNQ